MSSSTSSPHFRENVAGAATRSTFMTSEELHALLNLPFAYVSQTPPTYRTPSDNLSKPSPSDVYGSPYRAELSPYPGSDIWHNSPSTSSHVPPYLKSGGQVGLQNASPSGELNALNNKEKEISSDESWPQLPKYTDFTEIFTREEYAAIAICYDIYGSSSSTFITADEVFRTRKEVVLDLIWRFQTYDVLQHMKSLEEFDEFDFYERIYGTPVSFHYSSIMSSTTSADNQRSEEPRPLPNHFASRLQQGDLAARLLQANEASLSRRGKADQGIRRWVQANEIGFQTRHGVASPLNSDVSIMSFHFDELFKWVKKKAEKSTSSSSSYGTKSGYHSRSSSFSSESYIPGTVLTNSDFPYAYPIDLYSLGGSPSIDMRKTPSPSPGNDGDSATSSPLRSRIPTPPPPEAAKRRSRRPERSAKTKTRDPNAPKKPWSAYFSFLSQIRTQPQLLRKVFGDETATEKQSVLAARWWREMTDAERKPFIDKAYQDKAEYHEAVKVYEKSRASAK
ncbi:hypothetical protein BDN70DRAFT_879788 [Pholiota conissans]|uniref:HMG box domain-containing protein n=1 Tax=Pholiota conissans TaxID=109636 RepID=A0A9P5Z339_9AGAR|nr:hypothetical protein BDN70DRAFT_879788 [Pholiota conissans]